jgi:hypothetical protein
MAPGSSRHYAEKPPSGSSLRITVNFLPFISTITPTPQRTLIKRYKLGTKNQYLNKCALTAAMVEGRVLEKASYAMINS